MSFYLKLSMRIWRTNKMDYRIKNLIVAGVLISGVFLLFSGNAFAMARRPSTSSEVKEVQIPKILLTLERAYELALRRSETVAISREGIAQTKADWLEATGEAIGDGDFVMTDTLQDPTQSDSGGSSVSSTFSAEERRERKFVISQPIFQGFKSLGAFIGAGSLSRQRIEEYKHSKEVLFQDVSHAFYEYLRLREDLKTIENTHKLFEERIQQLKEREKVGRSRPGEIATARSRMKALEAELAQTRRLYSTAGYILEFYTGIPSEDAEFKDVSLPKEDLEEPLDPRTMAQDRTDVKAAYQAMKTARQALVVAQSDLWPKITMDANQYEKREGFQASTNWDVLFKVNVPLYRGGTTLAAVKSKISDWKKAKLNYSLAKRKAELEIKEAFDDWVGSVEQDKAFKDAVRAADENYQLQKEDYAKNLVNNLDVLAALEELFSTTRSAHQSYYAMKENYWRYQIATGKCCSVSVFQPADEVAS